MTDDDMDARLRTAGAAWRTTTDGSNATDEGPSSTETHQTLSPEETLEFGRPVRGRRRPRTGRHRTAWLASAAAVAAVLVAGGGFALGRLGGGDDGHRATGAESAALENTTWQLLGYGGEQLRKSSLSTLYLHDGAFVADDTCGLYNGRAAVDGDHLRLSDIEDRFYNCTDAVGEVTFQQGLKTLRGDPSWRIDGDRLTISGDGPTLHLAAAPNLPAPTPDRPTLTGATWRLVTVADATGTQYRFGGNTDLRIDGNHLRASDTCNTLSSTLQVDYPILKLDGVGSTLIGCPENGAARVVDRVLTGNVRADFRDATLTLTKEGAGTLTYRWQPDDEQATDPRRLAATDWQLTSIAGDPASGITLRVADGRLEVAADCATINVPVELGPGTLAAQSLARVPEKGCSTERQTVTSLLSTGVALWRIAGHQLVINQAGAQGFALVFDAAKDVSVASVELPGTWKLTEIEQDTSGTSSGRSVENGPTVRFDDKGDFTVDARCSQLFGKGAVDAKEIVFTDVRPSPHSCPALPAGVYDDGNDMATIVRTLSGRVGWVIDNGQLKLTKAGTTLTFER